VLRAPRTTGRSRADGGAQRASPEAPERLVELQRSAGNRALALSLSGHARTPGAAPAGARLARVIGFGQLAGAAVPGGPMLGPAAGFGFYRVTEGVPPKVRRPAWVGFWKVNRPPAGSPLARNHIVSYQLIAEALRNVAQALYAAAAARRAAPTPATLIALNARNQQLNAITNSLFPGGAAVPGFGAMQARRTALVNEIAAIVNYAAPTALEQQRLGWRATRLESALYSAQQNVRLGDATMNQRIGAHVDPILSPQLAELQAPGVVANMPAGVPVPPLWAGATNNNPPAPPVAMNTLFYTLPEPGNAIVYRFNIAAEAHLGNNVDIVRNTAPVVPNYTVNAPLSSGRWAVPAAGGPWPAAPLPPIALPPGAGNQPVVVFDPAGVGLPHRFG
jgi:hypothetical protein